MNGVDFVWHVLNFLMPALVVAALTALAARWLTPGQRPSRPWWQVALLGAAAGWIVQMVGLALTGSDGRMATYVAMLLAVATTQWWLLFRPGR